MPAEDEWQPFLDQLRKEVPGLPGSLTRDFDVSSHGLLGHTQRTAIRHYLARRLPEAAPDAIRVCRTLGEVFDLVGGLSPEVAGTIRRDRFRTANVHLRPIAPGDHLALYQASLDPDTAYAWRFRGRTPSYEQFQHSLYAGVLAQFAVAANDDGRLVGLVIAYEEHMDAGHCRIGFQRVGDSSVNGSMLEGMLLLFEYAFRHWPFRKLYFEVPAYNRYLLAGLENSVELEGTLKEYVFYANRRWDLDFVSFSRDSWEGFLEKIGVGTLELPDP